MRVIVSLSVNILIKCILIISLWEISVDHNKIVLSVSVTNFKTEKPVDHGV